MKRIIFLVGIMLGVVAYAKVGVRHVEQDGGFSYCPPKGWIVRKVPGLKYSVIVGPIDESFATNINFLDDKYTGSLEDYVKDDISDMEKSFKDFVLIKKVIFTTSKKMNGILAITTDKDDKKAIRNNHLYFQRSNGNILAITLTCLASSGEKYDSVFEESIKTLDIFK